MKTTNANADAIFCQFNDTIDKWIGYLDDYSLEMLCQRPQSSAWSLGRLYIHIIEDTSYFVEQIKTSLTNNDNTEKDKHEHAKAMFASNEFPDILMSNPNNTPDNRQPESKTQLSQALLAIRKEINDLYSTSDFSTAPGKTKHPGLLFFNALEWLHFADMHMRHHFRQKRRIDMKLFA